MGDVVSAVQPDWRIIKCDQTKMCGKEWIEKKQITACGVYYLVDVNLHVYICSLTPALEAWPMGAYAEFATEEARDADDGEAEVDLLSAEEATTYFGTEMAQRPSEPASKYIDIPPQKDSETDYGFRVAEAVREYLAANPCSF